MFVDVGTMTLTANADLKSECFVNVTGKHEATLNPIGVVLRPTRQKLSAAVLFVGLADVSLADGKTVKVGDYVKSDATGKATPLAANESGGFRVVQLHGRKVTVMIR